MFQFFFLKSPTQRTLVKPYISHNTCRFSISLPAFVWKTNLFLHPYCSGLKSAVYTRGGEDRKASLPIGMPNIGALLFNLLSGWDGRPHAVCKEVML